MMGGVRIIFEDYDKTGCLYHVVNILDLKNVLQKGIRFNDKKTYFDKYYNFHEYFDKYRPEWIPSWVERKKAIYTSLNYKDDHQWHSHSAILKVYVDESKCWVANENLANMLYEPFVLQDMECFCGARSYIKEYGEEKVRYYWNHSLSFIDNKLHRKDKIQNYDAEVLVFQEISPKNIECIYIISDHEIKRTDKWQVRSDI